MADYWSSILRERNISRRAALRATVASGLGAVALSLVGCGSSSSGSSGPRKDASGLILTPTDTTAKAKPGGTLKHFLTADVNHFDALISDNVGVPHGEFYPRLLKFNTAKYPGAADGSSAGEAASSFEVSPDKLQITFKLRPDMKWDLRAPTNGRALDAQDVTFSWGKFVKFNNGAKDLAYDAQNAPTSSIASLTATDPQTVVAKLQTPDASILALLSISTKFFVMPRESDSGFDPKTQVRGHGPWLLDEYTPSVRLTYKKNPDYYVANRPFYDRVELPVVTEQAARIAQFRTGNIFTDIYGGAGGSQEDVLSTKKSLPALNLVQVDRFDRNAYFLAFGWEGDTPWKDARMRQAVSMMLDREAYADAILNRAGFAAEGLTLPVARHTAVGANWEGGPWMDPLDEKTFGPSAKYLQLNLPEAKKLMAAAGHPDGVTFDLWYLGGTQYGSVYSKVCEAYAGMMEDGGLKVNRQPLAYDKWLAGYSAGYRRAQYETGVVKGYQGMIVTGERDYATAAAQVGGEFNSRGPSYRGLTPDGKHPEQGDPKLEDLTNQIKQEFDVQKQNSLLHDLTRYETEQSYYVPQPSSAKAFTLWWPVIQNMGLNVGSSRVDLQACKLEYSIVSPK